MMTERGSVSCSLDGLLEKSEAKDFDFHIRGVDGRASLVVDTQQYPLCTLAENVNAARATKGFPLERAYVFLRRVQQTLWFEAADASEDNDALSFVLRQLHASLLQLPVVTSVLKNKKNFQVPLSAPMCLVGDYGGGGSFIYSRAQAEGDTTYRVIDEILDVVNLPVDRIVEKHGAVAMYRVSNIPEALLYSHSDLRSMLRIKFAEIQLLIDRSKLKNYPVMLPEN